MSCGSVHRSACLLENLNPDRGSDNWRRARHRGGAQVFLVAERAMLRTGTHLRRYYFPMGFRSAITLPMPTDEDHPREFHRPAAAGCFTVGDAFTRLTDIRLRDWRILGFISSRMLVRNCRIGNSLDRFRLVSKMSKGPPEDGGFRYISHPAGPTRIFSRLGVAPSTISPEEEPRRQLWRAGLGVVSLHCSWRVRRLPHVAPTFHMAFKGWLTRRES